MALSSIEMTLSFLNVVCLVKVSIQLISGSLDGDKSEEEEGARMIEVSPLRASGRSFTPGREEEGLGADLDCC